MPGHDPERFTLKPAGTSVDSVDLWVSLTTYGAALGLFLWFAESDAARIIGAVVAVIWGYLVIKDVMKWARAGALRKSLGKLLLTVDSHPLKIGDEFHVRVTHQMKSRIRISASTLRLHCDTMRIETYGIRDREQKIWVNVAQTDIFALQDMIVEAGSEMVMDAVGLIPEESLRTTDRIRWWLLLETSIDGMPKYSADFAVEVVPGS